MSPRRIALTGMGVITGHGRGPDALWTGLAAGGSAVREHTARFGGRTWVRYPMAVLTDSIEDLAARLPNQNFVQAHELDRDPDLVAIADSVGQALADAGIDYDLGANEIGLVVTHESPGLAEHLQSFFRWGETARAWLRSPVRFDPPEFLYRQKSDSVYRMHSFLYVHYLSAIFGLHGFGLYNNNACASGAFGLAVAADRIKSGESDVVVVAGGDVPEDGTKYRWFRDAGLYSQRGACRPFAAERDGLVLGSGAAAFVVEELAHARARGARVIAEWAAAGFSSEGWKVTMPNVAGDHYARAIGRALGAAGVAPRDVTLVAPHGVGAGMLDRFEAKTLAEIFGNGGTRWPALIVSKASLGHTLGGCVLVETAAALTALEHGEIPAGARCHEPDPGLPLGSPSSDTLGGRWTFLKCTNGFAGQNAAFVLRAAEA
jgi:3-oxoacyl-[acyl-carrier-protein] synthase II